MHCHNTGTKRKRTWLIMLLVAVLAVAWAVWGKRGLLTMSPFLIMGLLCPLIHGAMFLFMGKSMMHRAQPQQEPDRYVETETKNQTLETHS